MMNLLLMLDSESSELDSNQVFSPFSTNLESEIFDSACQHSDEESNFSQK